MSIPREILRVDRLSKKFCRLPRQAMLHAASDVGRGFLGLPRASGSLRPGEFWAVRDVSFALCRGESLAIIGGNGSGKSTLLNLLNGVLAPDTGTIAASGRVGALAALGAGFNPQLTGRENIAIAGLLAGMTPREVRALAESIIDFSGIGEFIDVPVHQYSSGMHSRLGFAIAVHVPADIVLIDEVLAVGDLAFSIKCLRKIIHLRESGRAVVLVTHAMHNVKFVCDRALWMDNGMARRHGDAGDVAAEYERTMMAAADVSAERLHYDDRVRLLSFEYPPSLASGQRLEIVAELEFTAPVERPLFCLHLHTAAGETLVFSHYSTDRAPPPDRIVGRQRLRITTAPLAVHVGTYAISFSLSERELGNYLFWHARAYPLDVVGASCGHGLCDAGVEFTLRPAAIETT
jgi:ABC-type polysaccharide/polyol phosphate transport system ATPase subunit